MQHVVHLRSGPSVLTLGPVCKEYLGLKFESDGVMGQINSYLYTDHDRLISFFEDMSIEWKGWKDKKVWESVEGDVHLAARHDSCSKVVLEIKLARSDDPDHPWRLQSQMQFDVGCLEQMAHKVRDLLRGNAGQ